MPHGATHILECNRHSCANGNISRLQVAASTAARIFWVQNLTRAVSQAENRYIDRVSRHVLATRQDLGIVLIVSRPRSRVQRDVDHVFSRR